MEFLFIPIIVILLLFFLMLYLGMAIKTVDKFNNNTDLGFSATEARAVSEKVSYKRDKDREIAMEEDYLYIKRMIDKRRNEGYTSYTTDTVLFDSTQSRLEQEGFKIQPHLTYQQMILW